MSSVVYALSAWIPILSSGFSLIITCSPTKNVPEVCVKLYAEAFGFAARYPVAPLDNPRTKEVKGTSVVVYSFARYRVV